MKKLVVVLILGTFGLGIIGVYTAALRQPLVSPLAFFKPREKPLLVYTFDNLAKTTFSPSKITLGQKISETNDYISQMFYFSVPTKPGSTTTKRVSGMINVPKGSGTYPIIVMLRGHVPIESYQTGIGTQPTGRAFATHGYITLAPDFLGFGESDNPSADNFEARFQTYTTTLTLLSSLDNLSVGLAASYSGKITAEGRKVGLWGHSNGGQIALSVLAIGSLPYPTVLWAPVGKSFPYSILAYTDEADDQGKTLRRALAIFETDYNTDDFSLSGYISRIRAPLVIHQGLSDQEVPVWWSDELVKELKNEGVEVEYQTYPGADHNLRGPAWTMAVTRSLEFYNQKLKD